MVDGGMLFLGPIGLRCFSCMMNGSMCFLGTIGNSFSGMMVGGRAVVSRFALMAEEEGDGGTDHDNRDDNM